MKILYIGDVREGTTSIDRMHSLERIGHTVTPFNVPPYESKHRIISSIQCRLHPRILLQRLNKDICHFVENSKPFDCAWVDKGVWIFPDTVEFLKKKCGRAVHYTPDPQILYFRSHQFIKSIPIYDHIVTTKDFELGLYEENGAKNVIHVPQSYCPVRYKDPQPSARFSADVGFIGRCEPYYLQQINEMAGVDKVVIFGDQWKKSANRKRVAPTLTVNGSVWKKEYISALASFKIGLGLLSKNYPEQHTTRTFEIPAAGTFMLAERTDEHQGFFAEGIEAEFFSDPDEMISKVKFYLKDEGARERIAVKGRLRCISSGYDTDSVVKKIMAQVGA